MGSTGSSAEDHAYFQAIESSFIRLRGAPLLLSPSDWQLAREWHRRGVPLELVLETLRQVFEKRQARGARGRVQGLRYCAPAVERAWQEQSELLATGRRQDRPSIDVAHRLARLAERLTGSERVPPGLAERVAGLEGAPEEIETALAELDRELLSTAAAAMGSDELSDIEVAIEKSLAAVAERLEGDEAVKVRRRLRSEAIRRRLGLPVLSLFAP